MHVIKKKLLFNGCLVDARFVPWTFVPKAPWRRFVPTLDDSYPGVWTFRTQSLDDSYPRAGRFVPKGWTFRTQCFFLIFCIWFGIFASKIVRCIQPVEWWSIRTHFLFISHSWFSLFYMHLFTNVWFFLYLTLQILRYERLSSNWVKYSWMTVKLNQVNNNYNNNFIHKWLFEWCV